LLKGRKNIGIVLFTKFNFFTKFKKKGTFENSKKSSFSQAEN